MPETAFRVDRIWEEARSGSAGAFTAWTIFARPDGQGSQIQPYQTTNAWIASLAQRAFEQDHLLAVTWADSRFGRKIVSAEVKEHAA